MIQRKQTLFLLISAILSIVCLCLPVGNLKSGTGMTDEVLYNLYLKTADGLCDFSSGILFIILLLTCTISVITIFMYHNRKRQARLCLLNMLLLAVWYAACLFTGFVTHNNGNTEFSLSFTSAFPGISMILSFMARKAILADEELVRSADRIR